MNLAHRAFVELYGKEPDVTLHVQYHGGFKGYNANVRRQGNIITFNLAKKFASCEPEIQIGIMQYLLNRLNKTKINTDNMDMYHAFLKHMSDLAPVTESHPVLEESFLRVNEIYFGGMMSQPNLVWGNHNTTLLGTYTYATDTIMISRVLENAPQELLDYVVYHEMLHKKHKFSCTTGRTHSHTKAFRADEAKYAVKDAEAQLRRFLSRARYAPRKMPKEEQQTFVQRVMGWL